jgi:hypothetical protein
VRLAVLLQNAERLGMLLVCGRGIACKRSLRYYGFDLDGFCYFKGMYFAIMLLCGKAEFKI